MPSVNGPEHRFMEMSLHNPGAMRKPASKAVAREFVNADKASGRKFRAGGMVKNPRKK